MPIERKGLGRGHIATYHNERDSIGVHISGFPIQSAFQFPRMLQEAPMRKCMQKWGNVRENALKNFKNLAGLKTTCLGAPGWLSQLSVPLSISAQVTISRFVSLSPASGSVLSARACFGSSIPLSLCPFPAHSLKNK